MGFGAEGLWGLGFRAVVLNRGGLGLLCCFCVGWAGLSLSVLGELLLLLGSGGFGTGGQARV